MRGTLILSLLAMLVCGCGDDGTPPPPPVDSGILFDTAPPPDSAVDAVTADAPPVDGEIPDAPFDAGLPPTCSYSGGEDLIDLGTDAMNRDRRMDFAGTDDGVIAVWAASRFGAENVFAKPIPASGMAGRDIFVTDDPLIHRSPTIVRIGSQYLVSWFDNTTLNFEIHAQTLGADGMPTGSAMQVTDNVLRDEQPNLLALGSGALLAWIEVDVSSRSLKVRPLTSSGGTTGSVSTASAMEDAPSQPVLAETTTGAAVAWTQTVGGASHAILQPLEASGATIGDPITLDTEGNAEGSIDLAVPASGGLAAFGVRVSGVRAQVRYRTLDAAAMPLGSEMVLTTGMETGTGPSVAAFAGGFALAYRALTGDGLTEPTIRVAFVATSGEVFDTLDLEPTTEAGGQTAVGVSRDGQVFVGWSERGMAGESHLYVARIRCE